MYTRERQKIRSNKLKPAFKNWQAINNKKNSETILTDVLVASVGNRPFSVQSLAVTSRLRLLKVKKHINKYLSKSRNPFYIVSYYFLDIIQSINLATQTSLDPV